MRIAFEVLGRLDWEQAVSELNLTGEQIAELQAYDELFGIGYSKRDDHRATAMTALLMQSNGAEKLESDWFRYLPETHDPPPDRRL